MTIFTNPDGEVMMPKPEYEAQGTMDRVDNLNDAIETFDPSEDAPLMWLCVTYWILGIGATTLLGIGIWAALS